MVKLGPFLVEQWLDKYEQDAKHDISDTCAASVSIEDLRKFSTRSGEETVLDFSRKLTYGDIAGSVELRTNISNLYKTNDDTHIPINNIVITPGGIAANFLLLYTLIGPGDHVVCGYPTFQQLYEVPKSVGAEVSFWKATEEDKYIPNVKYLEGLIKKNTKAIILCNPNNPTGSAAPREVLSQIVSIASKHNIWIIVDEVYHHLYHSLPSGTATPPSIIELGYPKTVAIGSMSKAYSLAGIRLGWIATPDAALVSKIDEYRDYTTICVSQLDDQIATYALSPAVLPHLLARNLALARHNLAILSAFVDEHRDVCRWVKPTSGTIALVEFSHDGVPVDDEAFCRRLLRDKGLLLVPAGLCFGLGGDFRGCVRIGYVGETANLVECLGLLREFLREEGKKGSSEEDGDGESFVEILSTEEGLTDDGNTQVAGTKSKCVCM